MAGNEVKATTALDQWSFQENYVERLMDNSAFTAAHPNNTLICAGPARFGSALDNPGEKLLPLGMIQNMSIAQQRPVQPLAALGSARTFFAAGKSQVSFSIARLMVNGRNLMRALYTQAVQQGIDFNTFDERPVRSSNDEQYFLNLDSELFYVPFGLAVLFRSVSHDAVGAFYIELCMLSSMQTGLSAGQNVIMENVSGMADRIRPIYPSTLKGIIGAPTSSTLSESVLGQAGSELPTDLLSR